MKVQIAKTEMSLTPLVFAFSALVVGEAISMRLPETALPRSSLHAASGHAPNRPASVGEIHAAQNNSLWEMAA